MAALGPGIRDVAREVGCSFQAVSAWPEVLPPRIADRVLAVMARRYLAPRLLGEGEPPPAEAAPRALRRGKAPEREAA